MSRAFVSVVVAGLLVLVYAIAQASSNYHAYITVNGVQHECPVERDGDGWHVRCDKAGIRVGP